MSIYGKLGSRIKELRKKTGLTQEQLSAAAGISPHFLSRIENAREKASLDTIDKLSKALGIPLNKLFTFGKSEESRKPGRNTFETILKGLSKNQQQFLMETVKDTALKLKKYKK